MEEGRLVDGLIAEWVLSMNGVNMDDTLYGGLASCIGPKGRQLLPAFSSDIALAWQVVEKVNLLREPNESEPGRMLYRKSDGRWAVAFYLPNGPTKDIAEADTAPGAICLAALHLAKVPV